MEAFLLRSNKSEPAQIAQVQELPAVYGHSWSPVIWMMMVVPASAAGSFSMQSLPQPHGTKRYATFMRAVCYRRFFITKRSGVTKQSLPQPHGTKRYATFMRAVCYRRFFITKRSGVTRQSQLRSHGVKEMMQPACRTHLSSGYFYFIWLMSCNKRCFSSAESVIHCSRSCV